MAMGFAVYKSLLVSARRFWDGCGVMAPQLHRRSWETSPLSRLGLTCMDEVKGELGTSKIIADNR